MSLQGLVCQGASNTMSWQIAFSDMNADMPYAMSDMYVGRVHDQLSEHTTTCLRQIVSGRDDGCVKEARPQNYLVKPFGVMVNIQVSMFNDVVVSISLSIFLYLCSCSIYNVIMFCYCFVSTGERHGNLSGKCRRQSPAPN